MALSVSALQNNRVKDCACWLLATSALGIGFLGVKGLEYADDIHKHLIPGAHFALANQPPAQIYFWLYWTMTGLHAVHLIIGIGLVSAMWWGVRRGQFSRENSAAVELMGLYWGFVDVVWIFLYPLLYLIDRHA